MRAEAERVKGLEQILAALLEVLPTPVMDRNDHGVGKSLRGFDGLAGVRSETEPPARLRRSCKQRYDAGIEPTRNLSGPVDPGNTPVT